jgi:hypothetical protein
MAQIIKPKRSETAGAAPGTDDLQTHEIAMNVHEKKVYTKAANGSIITIASHNPDQLTTQDLLAFAIALG